ncbi:MAG: hypothetical protein ACI9YT_001734 [Halobacteriales archaeon]|jgi:hypothetical protein
MGLASRRALLQSIGGLSIVALSGCQSIRNGPSPSEAPETEPSTTDGGTTSRGFPWGLETPVPEHCEPANRPEPTPLEKGLKPVQYPEYPDSVTAESAEAFVRDYERAYQHNLFIKEEFRPGFAEIDILIRVIRWWNVERSGRYVGGVRGELHVVDSFQPTGQTATPVPAVGGFSAWYYLTDRVALRKSVSYLTDETPPDFTGAALLVCD